MTATKTFVCAVCKETIATYEMVYIYGETRRDEYHMACYCGQTVKSNPCFIKAPVPVLLERRAN